MYYKSQGDDVTVVDVYVDDLLVTASSPKMVELFFEAMACLMIINLGEVRKFLGMRVSLGTKPYAWWTSMRQLKKCWRIMV